MVIAMAVNREWLKVLTPWIILIFTAGVSWGMFEGRIAGVESRITETETRTCQRIERVERAVEALVDIREDVAATRAAVESNSKWLERLDSRIEGGAR